MTLSELVQVLQATGYPVAYSHFDEESPPPSIPFICWMEVDSDHFHADNKTFQKVRHVNIELYSDKKDLTAEATLEALLDANDLPYQTLESYIESERLYQKVYELGVI
jgi:hypothetical protein